jgi:hypothetical protein
MRSCIIALALHVGAACPTTRPAAAEEVPAVSGRFPQEVARSFTASTGLPSDDVRRIEIDGKARVWAQTAEGWAVYQNGNWTASEAPANSDFPAHPSKDQLAGLDEDSMTQVAVARDGQVVVATPQGLMQRAGAVLEALMVEDGLGRRWGASDVRGVAFDSLGRLWFASPAGVACRTDSSWQFYTGRDGLPYNDFTTVEAGRDGIVWFGTRLGAICFDGRQWAYRQGPRWLPHDEVRDIAVDAQGNVWFATAGGVGLIERRMMSLAEKAQFFEQEIEQYIRRTPYGYLSEVGLRRPGDKSEIIYSDSDNDGLWTSMYGAGACFAFAATGDAQAKDRAARAFEALRFLQKVHEGCEHAPPKGYVARTIRSTDLPDPNVGRIEHDRRERDTGDALWKVYEPRWPKSADGRWYWKSDTSSDELDGHYFFYPLYYDLVADTDAEKARVREVVRDLTDHLIDHGYHLVDHDGTPTRWGVFSPEALNHDPDWWIERGLNSLSMLSYLAVAAHVTGDEKYNRHIEHLVREHAYDTNAMIYKFHRGPGSGNHSDDEMAFMSFYNLLKYTRLEVLRQKILLSFFNAWANEQPERNPFFNFAYAAHGLGAQFEDAWGAKSLAPWDGWLDDSMETLRGFPLDRLNWPHRNSHRLDLVLLRRQQATRELTDRSGPPVGGLVDGKVLPVENRHFHHWNTNPWVLDYGGDGRSLASGTVFLLPYYMGLYHGFITEQSN